MANTMWQRHSAYTIKERWILPAPGAALEYYDPWEADRAAAKEEDRPVRQLLRLAQQLRPYRRAAELPLREHKALSSWLRRNGLLGILPHETLQYTTTAVWHEWLPPQARRAGEQPSGMRPIQRQVTRTATGWQTRFRLRGPERPLVHTLLGKPVSSEQLDGVAHPAEAIRLTWPKGEFVTESLGKRFQSFFRSKGPRKAQQRDYVPFVRRSSLEEYGEHLGVFIDTAYHLAAPLEALVDWEPDGDWRDRNAFRAMDQLNAAAGVVSPRGALMADGSKALGWNSHSLLGIFALMVLEDLSGGQRVMHCPVCGCFFLSAAHQARFCSSTCRSTHHKREQRRREAEEQEPP